MLLLFETAAGFALFKVNREDKLEKVDDLYREFDSLDAAQKVRSEGEGARARAVPPIHAISSLLVPCTHARTHPSLSLAPHHHQPTPLNRSSS
jgi:hypothetical protein